MDLTPPFIMPPFPSPAAGADTGLSIEPATATATAGLDTGATTEIENGAAAENGNPDEEDRADVKEEADAARPRFLPPSGCRCSFRRTVEDWAWGVNGTESPWAC